MNNEDTIIKKTQLVLNTYSQNECELWNIDTNFVNTWKRFVESINDNKINANNFTDNYCVVKKITKNRYIFLMQNKQIIMYKQLRNNEILYENKKIFTWAESSMRQFLQEGTALGFFLASDIKLSKIEINFELKIKITAEFIDIFSINFINNFDRYLFKSMQKSLWSGNSWEKNFGYSLFVCVLVKSWEYKKILNLEHIVTKIMQKSIDGEKTKKYFYLNEEQCLKEIDKVYNETYKSAVNNLLDNYEIENIIEVLVSSVENPYYIFFELNKNDKKEQKLALEWKEYANFINNYRIKLRKAIIESRVKKSNGSNSKHNDLENTYPEKWYVEDCEAAHIFDVWRISKYAKDLLYSNKSKEEIMEVINWAKDPENGILLLKQWHYYFDKDLIKFDTLGNILFTEKDHRFEAIDYKNNLKDVKIKQEILSEKMKFFLGKRN